MAAGQCLACVLPAGLLPQIYTNSGQSAQGPSLIHTATEVGRTRKHVRDGTIIPRSSVKGTFPEASLRISSKKLPRFLESSQGLLAGRRLGSGSLLGILLMFNARGSAVRPRASGGGGGGEIAGSGRRAGGNAGGAGGGRSSRKAEGATWGEAEAGAGRGAGGQSNAQRDFPGRQGRGAEGPAGQGPGTGGGQRSRDPRAGTAVGRGDRDQGRRAGGEGDVSRSLGTGGGSAGGRGAGAGPTYWGAGREGGRGQREGEWAAGGGGEEQRPYYAGRPGGSSGGGGAEFSGRGGRTSPPTGGGGSSSSRGTGGSSYSSRGGSSTRWEGGSRGPSSSGDSGAGSRGEGSSGSRGGSSSGRRGGRGGGRRYRRVVDQLEYAKQLREPLKERSYMDIVLDIMFDAKDTSRQPEFPNEHIEWTPSARGGGPNDVISVNSIVKSLKASRKDPNWKHFGLGPPRAPPGGELTPEQEYRRRHVYGPYGPYAHRAALYGWPRVARLDEPTIVVMTNVRDDEHQEEMRRNNMRVHYENAITTWQLQERQWLRQQQQQQLQLLLQGQQQQQSQQQLQLRGQQQQEQQQQVLAQRNMFFFFCFVHSVPVHRISQAPWEDWTLVAQVAVSSEAASVDHLQLLAQMPPKARSNVGKCVGWTRPDLVYVRRPYFEVRMEQQDPFFACMSDVLDPLLDGSLRTSDGDDDGPPSLYERICGALGRTRFTKPESLVEVFKKATFATRSKVLRLLFESLPTTMFPMRGRGGQGAGAGADEPGKEEGPEASPGDDEPLPDGPEDGPPGLKGYARAVYGAEGAGEGRGKDVRWGDTEEEEERKFWGEDEGEGYPAFEEGLEREEDGEPAPEWQMAGEYAGSDGEDDVPREAADSDFEKEMWESGQMSDEDREDGDVWEEGSREFDETASAESFWGTFQEEQEQGQEQGEGEGGDRGERGVAQDGEETPEDDQPRGPGIKVAVCPFDYNKLFEEVTIVRQCLWDSKDQRAAASGLPQET